MKRHPNNGRIRLSAVIILAAVAVVITVFVSRYFTAGKTILDLVRENKNLNLVLI
jgi:hypothetical protein